MKIQIFLLLAVCFAGCGGDSNPTTPENEAPEPSGRGTIDSLLAVTLPLVYTAGDYYEYANLLDRRYTFQRLSRDRNVPMEELIWDRREELIIADEIFSGRTNSRGQDVESMTLSIGAQYTTAYDDPDEPAGEEWTEVWTTIDLHVLINDPLRPGGNGFLNLLIDSRQVFVVRPDPESRGDWIIVKQRDEFRINKGATGSSTEEAFWSDLKELFRPNGEYGP